MQLQKFLALSGIVLLGNVVGTLADLEPDEVPQQCKQVCNSIVERSDHCDRTTHDDHAEKECMCKLENASTVVPQCEACVAKFHSEVSDHSDPHDNDVYDIIKFCHFTTTSYNGGAMAETSTGSSMPSATSAAGSSPTAAATTSAAGSPAPTSSSGGGAGGGGVIPSAPTMAPSSTPLISGSASPSMSGSVSGSASSSMPVYTGGANVMNAGNALGLSFACVAAFL